VHGPKIGRGRATSNISRAGVESDQARISDAIACVSYITRSTVGGWCILINKLQRGVPKPPGELAVRVPSAGNSLAYFFYLTITELHWSARFAVDARAADVICPGVALLSSCACLASSG
jgi:hypothetical protein